MPCGLLTTTQGCSRMCILTLWSPPEHCYLFVCSIVLICCQTKYQTRKLMQCASSSHCGALLHSAICLIVLISRYKQTDKGIFVINIFTLWGPLAQYYVLRLHFSRLPSNTAATATNCAQPDVGQWVPR